MIELNQLFHNYNYTILPHEKNLNHERLTKTQGQISVVRMVFMGVILLIGGMVMMSVVSWWSPKVSTGIEKELAFFERLLLVLLGILGSATVALYDQRNGKDDG